MPYHPTYPSMLQNPANPAYNPNMPGPDWANLVATIYKGLQETKDRKRGESQQAEDMEWKRLQRELAKQESELGIKAGKLDVAAKERAAKDYIPPKMKMFLEGIDTAGKQKHEERMIEKRGQVERDTIKARIDEDNKSNKDRIKKNASIANAYRREKADIEKKYTENIDDINKQYNAAVAKIKGDRNIDEKRTKGTTPNPYMRALQSALLNKKRSMAELEARKKQQLDGLDELYGRFLSGEDDFDVYSTSKPKADAGKGSVPDGAPTATNPQTGEKIVKINGQWVKDPRF